MLLSSGLPLGLSCVCAQRDMSQLCLVCIADHSIFVGDLAPDVTDYVLQDHFRNYYPSVRSAKVRKLTTQICVEGGACSEVLGSLARVQMARVQTSVL